MRTLAIAVVLVALTALALADDWRQAGPDYAWSFPRDHFTHGEYRIEWWYLTGHLESIDTPERRFGYQFTVFRIGLTPRGPDLDSEWAATDLLMGHASITDEREGRHRFSEVLYRAVPLLAGFDPPPGPRIAWTRGPVGTDRGWSLEWNGGGFDFEAADDRQRFSFDLRTTAAKPRIFQGPNGLSRKSALPGAASLYYSFTRLETQGEVELDGEIFRVRGRSWMDKEFSTSQLGDDQAGWDWFSLQLDDGRELMLYEMRHADGGKSFGRGTLVEASGEARYLEPTEWSARATDRWSSERTGTVYPSRWLVAVPGAGLELIVVPVLASQENVARLAGGLHYWEGAVLIRDREGNPVGRGYVELTGYGEANRPPV